MILLYRKFKILNIVLIFLISSCTSLPGSNMYTGNIFNSDAPNADMIKITPRVIADANKKNFSKTTKISSFFTNNTSSYTYKVGPGDVLNVTVWDHPELTIPAGQFRSAGEAGNVVHQDGTIFYPYVGNLKVQGLHVSDIRELITNNLSEYIENPQVDVSVASFNSQKVFVSGAVNLPSALPITNVPLSLVNAISIAGGLSPNADWQSVTITRKNDGDTLTQIVDLNSLLLNGEVSQNLLLLPGDLIHVPRNDALKVFVMGDVNNPKTQTIGRNGLTLAEAINNAGGINEGTANRSGIFVLRASNNALDEVKVYQLNADITSRMVLSTKFYLEPMDIVYITTAPVARWNLLVTQIVPSVKALYELNRIDVDQGVN